MHRLSSLVCTLVASVGFSSAAHAAAATATVTPATGGNGVPVVFGHAAFDLADVGYQQSEFFVQGTASAYLPVGPLTSNGIWTVAPSASAPYKTRIIVNRPINDGDFNGTVLVEWMNVSGGVDATPDWQHMHDELVRSGFAWVGVSAQLVGVNQLKCPALAPPACPAPGDPARYGSLVHPTDSYSYDIFSQAGQAVRDQAALVLGGLVPQHIIAAGESQSAGRMVTYIDAVHPLVHVYEAFVVHSRGANGAALSQTPLPAVPTPVPTLIRNDLSEMVIVANMETDAGALQSRRADDDHYRLWEIAGTSHFDEYGLIQAQDDVGDRSTVADWFDSMQHPTSNPSPLFACVVPINTGPATFVMRALIRHLNDWLVDGTPPPNAPRLQTVSIVPPVYAADANGNVLGGIRTPAVDAPIARLNGLGQPTGGSNVFCVLFGITIPFTQQQLVDLYVNHDGFVSAWNKATQKAVKAGFVLKEDAQDIKVVGAQSTFLP
jgi:alpha/beta hydrolase family protein